MAKVNAPLLSFGADGQIGKSVVFSRWRGVPYARQRVVPANPRTLAQQAVRSAFALFGNIWLYMPNGWRAPWDAFAVGRPFTGRNRFMGNNVRLNQGEADISQLMFSPGANGGIPPESGTITPGDTLAAIALDIPTPPNGWTLVGSSAVAVTNLDPSDPWTGEIVFQQETGTPNAFNLTGLTNDVEYVVGVWLVWTKPNGQTAYSVAISDVIEPVS